MTKRTLATLFLLSIPALPAPPALPAFPALPALAAEPTVKGPERGALVIVGGGRVGTDILTRFFDLAGGRDAPLVTLSGNALNRAKVAEFGCPYALGTDLRNLRFSANRTRALAIRTVMDKERTAPSGDKHDYYSIGRYFWPDDAKSDGLPWVRRDGQVNPDVFSTQYDKVASDAMFSAR